MASSPSSSATRRNTSSSSARGAPTPFCKVCRDAGRPESEYTSHYVKDQPGPNGKVACPILLNQACRICENLGHTSSYCPQYRRPRREERYIEREREPRREERRDISFNRLRDDTERRDRETRDRDESYHREQDRRSKPWLQAALKPASREQPRREPYAHPHGPRVRLQLEDKALSVSTSAPSIELELPKWGTPDYLRLFQTDDTASSEPTNIIVADTAAPAPTAAAPTIDVRKVELHHAANWGDEDTETPFVCDPEQMTRKFFEEEIMAGLTTAEEFDFIAMCDDQSQLPFAGE